MMDFLNFAFGSLWHFLGVAILIQVSGTAVAEVVKAFRRVTP